MKNKILILMLMFMALCIAIVSADPLNVTLDPDGFLSPGRMALASTQTGLSTNAVYYGMRVNGNSSTYSCSLYTTENGSAVINGWHAVQTMTVNNDTSTNFTLRNSIADNETLYEWNVYCNATNTIEANWSGGTILAGNYSFGTDVTVPVIDWDSVYNPDEKWFTTTNGVVFNMTSYERNPDVCRLTLDINATHGGNNGTQLMNINSSAQKRVYLNGTQFTFEVFNGSTTGTAFPETGSGYLYNVICNDSAGNANSPVNQTFFVDATAPAAFDINMSMFYVGMRNAYSGANGTDTTPQVGFEKSVDINISHYQVTFYNSTFGNIPGTVNVTVTANSLNTTTQNPDYLSLFTSVNMTSLLYGIPYVMVITAFDLAGNNVNATTVTNTYWATDINRDLDAGWNIISNPSSMINGSNMLLQDIRNWTGATTVSTYNASHEFTSHTLGGAYGAVEVLAGQPIFIYVSADTTFNDLIWNTSAFPNKVNLTNAGSSNWSIVTNYNYTEGVKHVQGIDNYLNVNAGISIQNDSEINVSYFSFYNNTASSGNKYIPTKANWSYNNATEIRFGETLWCLTEGGMGYKAGEETNLTPLEIYNDLQWSLVG